MFCLTCDSISARRSPIASFRVTWLTTARIALSATSRIVSSGWDNWNRKSSGLRIIQATQKSQVEEILIPGQHQIVGTRRTHVDRSDRLYIDLLHTLDRR